MYYYHASEKQGLKYLDPGKTKSTHLKSLKPYVFVTDDKSYAAGFSFEHSSNEGFEYGRRGEDEPWVLVIPKKYLSRLKRPSSIYYIAGGGFRKVHGVTTPEYYKKGKAKVIKEEKYKTAAECLKINGVEVRIK